jgi:hypothetical protein
VHGAPGFGPQQLKPPTPKHNDQHQTPTPHAIITPTPRLGSNGASLPGSPTYELQPDYGHRDVVLEISDGYGIIARGAVSCKRLWQIGMEHASMGDGDEGSGFGDDDAPVPAGAEGAAGAGAGGNGGICNWFKEDTQVPLRAGATGIWVSVFGEGGGAGQVLLSIARLQREMPPAEGGGGAPGGDGNATARANTLKVSSCQAYDYLLMAALRAQVGLIWWGDEGFGGSMA